jgi:hypothetical protein
VASIPRCRLKPEGLKVIKDFVGPGKKPRTDVEKEMALYLRRQWQEAAAAKRIKRTKGLEQLQKALALIERSKPKLELHMQGNPLPANIQDALTDSEEWTGITALFRLPSLFADLSIYLRPNRKMQKLGTECLDLAGMIQSFEHLGPTFVSRLNENFDGQRPAPSDVQPVDQLAWIVDILARTVKAAHLEESKTRGPENSLHTGLFAGIRRNL